MKKIVVVLLVLLVGGLWWLNQKSEKPQDEIKLFGNVDIRQVDMSFKVSGILKEMLFEEGDKVKKGDLLATLEDRDYRDNYQKALSELKRYEAKMKEAISVLETHAPLCDKNITSQRDCTSYTNAKDEAVAAYETALVNSQYEKNLLEDTKIYAPSDGVISSRVQEPGAVVAAGQIVYTLTKDEPLWVRAYIPQKYLGNITYGTKVLISTDSMDFNAQQKKTYHGHVGYISSVAEFSPKTVQTEDLRVDLVYRIHVYFDDGDEFVRQGMPVTLLIDLKQKEN